jgi:N-methylhydantoinase A/oxoprolinase/acetone carboxylase beta subunit
VVEAVRRAKALFKAGFAEVRIVHGSTVATNALLQRAGEPVAFVTTKGFRDMLLIGRQNRPELYALEIKRPAPLTAEENWFTVRERISAQGEVVQRLDPAEVDRLVETIASRGLKHVAVCLLFSFVNPEHERLIGERCRRAGLTVSLSSDVLPEFREYERASTTVINASLRPTVEAYLRALADGLSLSPSPGTPGERRGEGLQRGRTEGPHPCPLPEYREREKGAIPLPALGGMPPLSAAATRGSASCSPARIRGTREGRRSSS